MGNAQMQSDYYWTYTDEPHATRRKEILAKYPQVKELYGYDPTLKWKVLFWVVTQFLAAWALRSAEWWLIILAVYCFGAFSTHALVLGMHEISHHLAFPSAMPNKILGIFANSATVFPHFSMFQRYHMEHHQYQGVEGMDVDIPSAFEGRIFRTTLLKLLWVFFQPVFYIFRPLLMKPKKPNVWDILNWVVILSVDYLIYLWLGPRALGYMALSIFVGSGLHPVGGHFIAEHYVFVKGQETYSYYGPLNLVCFNVGYHNEHHDFPRIPGSRLPQLKAMCPQYYDLPHYTSWTAVIYNYITDSSVGPFSRVKRTVAKREKAQ